MALELGRSRLVARARAQPGLAAGIFLAVLVLAALALRPDLLALEWRDGRWYGLPVDVLHRAAPVVLLAVGTSAVIGSGGVDLSVGTTMVMAGTGAALLVRDAALAPAAAAALSLAGGLVLGLWNGALVALLGVAPIVATLVLYTSGRGIAQVWSAGQIVPLPEGALAWLARAPVAGLPSSVWIALGAALALALFTRRTPFGLLVEAFGDNERAAWLAGAPRTGILLACYAIAGACAALAGLVACADLRAADPANLGAFLELDAILAVVLGGGKLGGGRTSIAGAVLGAVLLQALTHAWIAAGTGHEAALAGKAGAVLVVSALRSPRLGELLRRRGRAAA